MYHFTCLCGTKIVTPFKRGACPHCARLYDLRWPNDQAAPAAAPALPVKPIARAAKAFGVD